MAGCINTLRLVAFLVAWLVVVPAQAQLLAVLDKSKPTDAGLSQAKLNVMTQAVRGEVRRRVPEEIQILTEESTVSILRDMGVNLAECEGECEVDIARKLQADWLISVSIVRLGEGWTLQLNLFETTSGALKGSERGRASREEQLEALALEKAGLLALLVGRRADAATAGRLGGGGQDWEMPATVGVLVAIESTPPGATVTLDNSYLGETPLSRELAPGPHSLKLSLARYEDLTERVTVEKKTTLSRTLTPLFGWLSVESTPAGQPVYVNGAKVGDTPLKDHILGHGPHAVLVGDSTRAYPEGERFTLGKGERKNLRYDVLLRTGGLVVRCADGRGNALEQPVTVDGTSRGKSPMQLKLPIGDHQVEAGGKRQAVSIREKQTGEMTFLIEEITTPSIGNDIKSDIKSYHPSMEKNIVEIEFGVMQHYGLKEYKKPQDTIIGVKYYRSIWQENFGVLFSYEIGGSSVNDEKYRYESLQTQLASVGIQMMTKIASGTDIFLYICPTFLRTQLGVKHVDEDDEIYYRAEAIDSKGIRYGIGVSGIIDDMYISISASYLSWESYYSYKKFDVNCINMELGFGYEW